MKTRNTQRELITMDDINKIFNTSSGDINFSRLESIGIRVVPISENFYTVEDVLWIKIYLWLSTSIKSIAELSKCIADIKTYIQLNRGELVRVSLLRINNYVVICDKSSIVKPSSLASDEKVYSLSLSYYYDSVCKVLRSVRKPHDEFDSERATTLPS